MKDILLTGQRIRKELKLLGIIFLCAILLNVFSIVYFKTSWIELVSCMHIVLFITLVCYITLVFFRIIIFFITSRSPGS